MKQNKNLNTINTETARKSNFFNQKEKENIYYTDCESNKMSITTKIVGLYGWFLMAFDHQSFILEWLSNK